MSPEKKLLDLVSERSLVNLMVQFYGEGQRQRMSCKEVDVTNARNLINLAFKRRLMEKGTD